MSTELFDALEVPKRPEKIPCFELDLVLRTEKMNPMNLFFILFALFCSAVFSQRSDFYDAYDYDLRNYKAEYEGEKFREYQLPPKRDKPALINPKDVRRPFDPNMMIPPPAGLRRPVQAQNFNFANSPVNPLTGDLNPSAILGNQNNGRQKREEQKKQIEEASKKAYTETPYRRGEIIFFTTLPFASAIAIGAALLVDAATGANKRNKITGKRNFSFYRSSGGAAFVGLTAVGLSFGNVYLDRLQVEEFEKQKKINPELDRHLGYDFRMDFTLGQISF